jgi:hypothetical protein
MRVLIRGGSISAGKGVVRSYADIVRYELAPAGIEVINVSRERDTSFQGVWGFAEDIAPARPDILVLHFGIDDIYRPVYRSEFRENIVQIVRLARILFNPRTFLMSSHTFHSSFDMDGAYIIYHALREVAHDLECVFVPVHLYWMNRLFETGRKHAALVQVDDRLPNEEGHAIYAEALMRALRDGGITG